MNMGSKYEMNCVECEDSDLSFQIVQGLRTLELCVDNLQPDFLYDHIQPVRADLMQALWRSLHNTTDQVAHVAFR